MQRHQHPRDARRLQPGQQGRGEVQPSRGRRHGAGPVGEHSLVVPFILCRRPVRTMDIRRQRQRPGPPQRVGERLVRPVEPKRHAPVRIPVGRPPPLGPPPPQRSADRPAAAAAHSAPARARSRPRRAGPASARSAPRPAGPPSAPGSPACRSQPARRPAAAAPATRARPGPARHRQPPAAAPHPVDAPAHGRCCPAATRNRTRTTARQAAGTSSSGKVRSS